MRVIGRTATRVHFVLVLAIALTGLGIIALVAAEFMSPDSYTRDLAILATIITAPIWVVGIAAAIDAASVLRGRKVSVRRALFWAVGAILGGVLLAASFGQVDLIVGLLTAPATVGFQWPAFNIAMGSRSLYVDRPAFWMPLVALLLGSASLVATVVDQRTAGRVEISARES